MRPGKEAVKALGRIIAITNQKGGVGKTTTAVNLSACVAAEGKRTLLIDIDPQGNATSGLGMADRQGHTVYEVLINGAAPDSAVVDTGFSGLMLMRAGIELAGAEVELVAEEGREDRLKRALEALRAEYDYIFIDCPPSLGLLTLNALTAADGVLVPIQCEYYALEGVGQLINTVKLVRKKLNPQLAVEGIALTMYDARTNLSAQVVREVRAHFPEEAFETLIPRNVRLSEAPSYGMPIGEYDAKCAGAVAYRDLARELIRRTQ
jgi:chromosome partitioning protein